MRLLVINIITICLAASVFAYDFSFLSPNSVRVGEEFSVTLNVSDDKAYDVKIFVHNSTDKAVSRKEIISSIYEVDKWKDSWYFISSLPNNDYLIKVDDGSLEDNFICVRIREKGSTTFKEECRGILVSSSKDSSFDGLKLSSEEKIFLNPKEDAHYVSKDQKTLDLLSISFMIFVLMVLIFVLFKKFL